MALLNKLKYKMKSSFSQTGLSSPYRQLGDREITCHILTTKYSPHKTKSSHDKENTYMKNYVKYTGYNTMVMLYYVIIMYTQNKTY